MNGVLIVSIIHRSVVFFAKYRSPAVQFTTFSILPQTLYCTSQDMPAILTPSLVLSHEEWPDADSDGALITTPSDKDDETKNPCDARHRTHWELRVRRSRL